MAGYLWLLCLAGLSQLEVEPRSVRLVGSDGGAQLVAGVRLSETTVRDITDSAVYTARDPSVAEVDAQGRVQARGPGRTTISVGLEGQRAEVAVEVVDFEDARPVGFTSQIVPILSRFGCNAGGCHGKATGQNGFRLSLLGFDPKFDYEALVREARGRRVSPEAPERSLLLKKTTAAIPHGGGRRLDPDSPEYRAIVRWIRGGLPFDLKDEPRLESIRVTPDQRTITALSSQQLRVSARYSDGSEIDVTRLAQYQSNVSDLASVSPQGRVRALENVGEAAIMVRFGGEVAVARIAIPRPGAILAWNEEPSDNPIDPLVNARLRALNLPPSAQCGDAEFARRSSLDIRGTLPSPAEVAALESDSTPDKRERWIATLLDSPEYADYFALKWSAILKNARGPQIFGGDNTKATTFAFHAWVRQAIAENRPYDQFAASLVSAKGDPITNPAVAWYRTRDFNNQNSEAVVEDTAQLFLGMRIQCAKCHHHPFERWSQDDYYGFSSFFSRLGRKPSDDPFTPRLYVLPSGKASHPNTGAEYEPKALGGPRFEHLGPRDDPRDQLATWLAAPDNPYFAKAVANRYWKHFFGRGLVEPEDDMRVTNPPTNPELLDTLARELVTSGYDLKHLIQLIATSQAYGRSSLPNEWNAGDRQNHARFYPRRLPAEVLLDAIDQVTGARESYAGMPADFRAVQLPDEGFGSYFLEVFGRPKRESVCECERTSEPSLAQRLHLLNSDEIESKVAGARAEEFAKSPPENDAGNITTLYQLCLARNPNEEERNTCLAHLAKARAHNTTKAGYEDLIWTLINSNEFLFNQ